MSRPWRPDCVVPDICDCYAGVADVLDIMMASRSKKHNIKALSNEKT